MDSNDLKASSPTLRQLNKAPRGENIEGMCEAGEDNRRQEVKVSEAIELRKDGYKSLETDSVVIACASNRDDKAYSYQPLDSPTSIRILELLPAKKRIRSTVISRYTSEKMHRATRPCPTYGAVRMTKVKSNVVTGP